MENLTLEKVENDSIYILSINNPPVNKLTSVLIEDLCDAIVRFREDTFGKVLILTGDGQKTFSSGADINEIASIKDSKRGRSLAEKGLQLCEVIDSSDKPIIAAINGVCLGGGNEIAIACHIRVADMGAKFGQPEINIGIIPGFGGTQRLPRLVGLSRARKMILTGETINAQEALKIGLIDEVVNDGFSLKKALLIAKKIICNSQLCVQLAQRAMRDGVDVALEDGLRTELDLFSQICDSEDMQEGVKAFLEKRMPIYKNA